MVDAFTPYLRAKTVYFWWRLGASSWILRSRTWSIVNFCVMGHHGTVCASTSLYKPGSPMKSAPAFPKTYQMLRNSRRGHYYWLERETNRLAVGDHSNDGRHDEPPKDPTGCDDGVLYVDKVRIAEEGLTLRITRDGDSGTEVRCTVPLLRPNGETSRTGADSHELKWLAQHLSCQVHIVTDAFQVTVSHLALGHLPVASR